MGRRKEGITRVAIIAMTLALAAVLAWGLALQQLRRPAAADAARRAPRKRELHASQRAIRDARAAGDAEAEPYYVETQRNADRRWQEMQNACGE